MSTSSTNLDPAKKVTLLKHLAAGKSLDVVATIVGLKRDQVLDVASRHGYPDTDKLAWAADVLDKKTDDDVAAAAVKTGPLEHGVTIDRDATEQRFEVFKKPAAAAPSADAAGPTQDLIAQGKQHPSKRIQAAANKVLDDLDRLRTLLREDEEKHAARRKAEREKAAARAEVERLKQQLAEAQAKLRGGKAPAKETKAAKAPRERGALDFPCRNDGCDKAYDTPQGRSMHERMKCDHRDQAVAS